MEIKLNVGNVIVRIPIRTKMKTKKEKHFMVEDDIIARQIKKDNSDIPNENYLETQRNTAGEENKLGNMPVGVIPLNSVDNQSAENELTNNEAKDGI